MSASLVGSEMCIRDRVSPPQALKAFLFAARISINQVTAAERAVCEPWGCLLYTSDAADDM
eukprot:11395500-Alexandrium_andersonii.AAC.1